MSSPIGSGRPGNIFGSAGVTHEAAPASSQAAPGTPAGLRAPLGLTLPAPPRHDSPFGDSAATSADTAQRAGATRDAASQPASSRGVPSRAGVAQGKLNAAAEKHGQAKQVGVEVAKSSFFKKCIGVATAVAAVAIAATLTAMSFGAAAPLLGLACASLVVAGGDAVCAYRNVKNAEASAAGKEPPYQLPMGNSCVGNLMHTLLTACGVSDGNARTASKAVSTVVAAGLAIASVAVGAGLADVPMALKIASAAASGINTAVGLLSAGSRLITDDLDRNFVQTAAADVVAEAERLHPRNGGELDVAGQQMADRIVGELVDGKPLLLLEKALADGGLNTDAARGGLGLAGAVAKASGVVEIVGSMFSGMRV